MYRTKQKTPTADTYKALESAYNYFNSSLFNNLLPDCVITLQRKKGAYGYFHGNTWSDLKDEFLKDEIAMNPNSFRERPLISTLSTLVHEMVHLQQHHFGKPSRTGYHNKQWANMMEAVGLIPSDTGTEGGKKTGQRMTHYIEEGGAFEVAAKVLLSDGFTIPWKALTGDEATAKKKKASKTRYNCSNCGINAWGKPELNIVCGNCDLKMEPETSEEEEN